jgi:hypothetical protein
MSGIVEHHENMKLEQSRNNYLQQLIDGEDIKGAAAGITKKVIADGEESLSQKQSYVFNEEVVKPFLYLKCEQCGTQIDFDDAYEALHGNMLCASCQYDRDKLMGKR